MLSGMRKVTRGWIAGGFIALLMASFAIWGVNDAFRPVSSNAVAQGDDLKVPAADFKREFDAAIEQIRAEQQPTVTTQQAVAGGVHTAVLQRLIGQRALDRLARRMGVGASDQMVATAIREDEAFKSQITGAFDRETFRQLLAQNGLTEADYTERLRASIGRRQLASAAVAGVTAPKGFADLLYAFESERRVVSIAAITRARVGAPPEPGEADLRAFYKDNSARFATPEYRTLTLVIADPKAFAAKVEVSEAQIREMYAFRAPKLGKAERRSFVVISTPDQAKAAEAARRLAAGEDPGAIASALKGQLAPFTLAQKSEAPDAVIAEAVFKLQAGQSTGAVKGTLSWGAAKVSDIVPSEVPTFEALRDTIRAEIAEEEASQLLNDAVARFEDERAGGKALEEAARAAGLSPVRIENVDARGADAEGAPAALLAGAPELLKAAFAAAPDEPTDFTPIADGGYALVRVDGIKAAGVRPFEAVKPVLTLAWKARRTGEQMRQLADKVVKQAAAGASFAALVKAERLAPVAASQTLDRRAAQESNAPALGQAIFQAREGEAVQAPDARGEAILVALVEKVSRQPPEANPQLVAEVANAARDMLSNDMLATLQTAAAQAAKVRTDEALVRRSIGLEGDAAGAQAGGEEAAGDQGANPE